jgi:hypothetical protein
MLRNLIAAGFCSVLAAACAQAPAANAVTAAIEKSASYGHAMPAGDSQPLATVALDQQKNGSVIKVSGRVGAVCQAKGCWMMLSDGDAAVRVKFGEDAFFIPKDATGNAVVHGTWQVREMSEKEARHMAKDAGADPTKIIGAQRELQIIADAVHIDAFP